MHWRERLREFGCAWDGAVASIVAFTAALLRIAAASRDAIRVDRSSAELAQVQGTLESALQRILRTATPSPREFLPAAVFDELCVALDSHQLRPGFAALTAARIVDAHCGREFIDAFRVRHGERITPGAPIPVVPFPCDRLGQREQAHTLAALGRRTGDPKLRTDPVDQTDHLRLAPPEIADLRVRYVWADSWLAPVLADTRFGLGVTCSTQFTEELTWQEYVAGSGYRFYGVVPKDAVEQERRLAHILQEATRAQASVVVLPELSVTPDILRSLGDRGLFTPLPLVVAGSYHEHPDHPGPGRNICKVFSYGDEVYTHEKFSDFHYAHAGARCHEDLHRADGTAGFDLLVGANSTAIILICKDILGDAQEMVRKLAPTLVLVPAMSPETDDFASVAERLARDPQAFTGIACAGPALNTIYGRPSRDQPVISTRQESGAAVIFDLSGIRVNQPSINHELTFN